MHTFVEELFAFVPIIVNQDYELMKVGFVVRCSQWLHVLFFFVVELMTEKNAVITTSTNLPVPNWFLQRTLYILFQVLYKYFIVFTKVITLPHAIFA